MRRSLLLLIAAAYLVAGCGIVDASPMTPTPAATPGGEPAAPSARPTARPTPTPATSTPMARTPAPTPAASPTRRPTLSPAAVAQRNRCPGQRTPGDGGIVSADSSNWAGYLVTGRAGTVTCVEGAWTEPTVKCPSRGTAAVAIWVGIDGAATGTRTTPLVQTGTSITCSGGSAEHTAWHEVYPSESALGWSFKVRAGDRMWAQVAYSGGKFRMTVADLTTGAANHVVQAVRGTTRQTAEWVVEAPSLGCPKACRRASLAQFTPVNLSASVVSVGQQLGGIVGPWERTRIRLLSGSRVAATTGPVLADGRSFRVTWVHR